MQKKQKGKHWIDACSLSPAVEQKRIIIKIAIFGSA